MDTTVLGRCLERALAADGRLIRVNVMVSDRPGGVADLCKLIASIGVSIKDILHERAWVVSDIFTVEVGNKNLFAHLNIQTLQIEVQNIQKTGQN